MVLSRDYSKIQKKFKKQYGRRWKEVFDLWVKDHGLRPDVPYGGRNKAEDFHRCPSCDGDGDEVCFECNGKGVVDEKDCNQCGGGGYISCTYCGGSGFILQEKWDKYWKDVEEKELLEEERVYETPDGFEVHGAHFDDGQGTEFDYNVFISKDPDGAVTIDGYSEHDLNTLRDFSVKKLTEIIKQIAPELDAEVVVRYLAEGEWYGLSDDARQFIDSLPNSYQNISEEMQVIWEANNKLDALSSWVNASDEDLREMAVSPDEVRGTEGFVSPLQEQPDFPFPNIPGEIPDSPEFPQPINEPDFEEEPIDKNSILVDTDYTKAASPSYGQYMKDAEDYYSVMTDIEGGFSKSQNYYKGFNIPELKYLGGNEMVALMDVDWLVEHAGNVVDENIDFYIDKMMKGEPIDSVPQIWVDEEGKITVGEGNHRIMAAKAMGFDSIPVRIYFNYHHAPVREGPVRDPDNPMWQEEQWDTYELPDNCPDCDGDGDITCTLCNGQGYENGIECEGCGGTGYEDCPTCGGTGDKQEEYQPPARPLVAKHRVCADCSQHMTYCDDCALHHHDEGWWQEHERIWEALNFPEDRWSKKLKDFTNLNSNEIFVCPKDIVTRQHPDQIPGLDIPIPEQNEEREPTRLEKKYGSFYVIPCNFCNKEFSDPDLEIARAKARDHATKEHTKDPIFNDKEDQGDHELETIDTEAEQALEVEQELESCPFGDFKTTNPAKMAQHKEIYHPELSYGHKDYTPAPNPQDITIWNYAASIKDVKTFKSNQPVNKDIAMSQEPASIQDDVMDLIEKVEGELETLEGFVRKGDFSKSGKLSLYLAHDIKELEQLLDHLNGGPKLTDKEKMEASALTTDGLKGSIADGGRTPVAPLAGTNINTNFVDPYIGHTNPPFPVGDKQYEPITVSVGQMGKEYSDFYDVQINWFNNALEKLDEIRKSFEAYLVEYKFNNKEHVDLWKKQPLGDKRPEYDI